MESSDECVFVIPPCAGDPNNSLIGGCAQCWDFFWGQFMIDGAQVGGDLVGEAGTTDAEQSGSVSLDYCTKGAASVASINVTTQTWANNESVTFSGIMIICYVGVPTGDTSFASVCVGAMVDLSPFIQNGDPSGQFFDIDNSMSL
jgi:hypothetical protein